MCGLWVFSHMCGGQKFLLGIFLHSSLSSFETGSLVWTELISLASLASLFWRSLIFLPECWHYRGSPPLCRWRGRTSSPHIYTAPASPMEPSPQSQFSSVFWDPRSLWRCILWSLIPGCALACVSPIAITLSRRRPEVCSWCASGGAFSEGVQYMALQLQSPVSQSFAFEKPSFPT